MNIERKIYNANRDKHIIVKLDGGVLLSKCLCGFTNCYSETGNKARIIQDNYIISVLNEYDNESKILHCYRCKLQYKIYNNLLIIIQSNKETVKVNNFHYSHDARHIKDLPNAKGEEVKNEKGVKFTFLKRGNAPK